VINPFASGKFEPTGRKYFFYQGDMEKILLDLVVDFYNDYERIIIITDPPYNLGIKYDNYTDEKKENEYIKMLSVMGSVPSIVIGYPEETVKYYVPALGIPYKYVAWCYNSNISRQFRLISFYHLIPNFDNVRMPYKNPNDKRIKELIAKGSKGRKSYDWFSDIQLVKNVSKEKMSHPCQIPEKLIRRLILLIQPSANLEYHPHFRDETLIVDPFCGVGTVNKVALEMGYDTLGIDLSPSYLKQAVERLKNDRSPNSSGE